MSLKVFQLDEANYYCGETVADAITAYIQDVGEEEARECMKDFGNPEEIPDHALDTMKIVDIDELGHPTQTFREALAQHTEAGPFASTEY